MKGLYYYTRKIYQFSQSKPIFERCRGTIISNTQFPLTHLFFTVKYGPFSSRIMPKKLRRLPDVAEGLILCHSADKDVPPSSRYERVFVYHGTSDKTFGMPDRKLDLNWFERYFLSGPKDLHKLKTYSHHGEDLERKIVKIGMFRSDPLFTGGYDRGEILERYRIDSGGKKIILYAPTWAWGGGTLKECFEIFARELLPKYTLIVRPHFNDRANIRAVSEWQRRNRREGLYIFAKQQHDIMDFIMAADLMIGDNSAVNYEFALTRRPMVFVKTHEKDVFVPPDEYNVKLCGPTFDPEKDGIVEKVEEAFGDARYAKKIAKLVDRSFYFNDGHAVDRACSFIVDRLAQKGIIDRERALRRYGKRFTYTDSYKY